MLVKISLKIFVLFHGLAWFMQVKVWTLGNIKFIQYYKIIYELFCEK